MIVMKRVIGNLLMFVLIVGFSNTTFSQDMWVTAKKVNEGPTEYIQGNRVKTCYYTVDRRFNFSILITDWVCPQSVQYNMMSKEWRSN